MNAPRPCPECTKPMDEGFVTSTNGSGLFWSKEAVTERLRPHGLLVLVPTGFTGSYSANLPGQRCPACGTILLRPK
ncbi:MAG: PF20097 family protein [Thermoplasmata archaeon]|jgi:hypothetical protein